MRSKLSNQRFMYLQNKLLLLLLYQILGAKKLWQPDVHGSVPRLIYGIIFQAHKCHRFVEVIECACLILNIGMLCFRVCMKISSDMMHLPKVCCLEVKNVTPRSTVSSAYHLKDVKIHNIFITNWNPTSLQMRSNL